MKMADQGVEPGAASPFADRSRSRSRSRSTKYALGFDNDPPKRVMQLMNCDKRFGRSNHLRSRPRPINEIPIDFFYFLLFYGVFFWVFGFVYWEEGRGWLGK